jgi:hypothetical protein
MIAESEDDLQHALVDAINEMIFTLEVRINRTKISTS